MTDVLVRGLDEALTGRTAQMMEAEMQVLQL